jgi:hypothetical protein
MGNPLKKGRTSFRAINLININSINPFKSDEEFIEVLKKNFRILLQMKKNGKK